MTDSRTGTGEARTGEGLRVAHVIGGGDTGGAMTHVLPLLAALRREGAEAGLICLGQGGLVEQAEERGLPVEVLPMAHRWDARVLGRLRALLREGDWDVVHTHGMRANLPLRLAALTGFRRRPCLLTTMHSDVLLDYTSPALAGTYSFLDRVTTPVVDTVVCVSGALRDRLQQRGYDASRLGVIHSGVEVSEAEGSSVEGSEAETPEVPSAPLPAPWGREAAGGRRCVGTVARLVPVKDIGLLLEVARVLAERMDDLQVGVAGDGPERERLQQAAETAGVGGTVVFLGEVRPVTPFLRGLEVYLMTSESEGLPLSVLEAMSVGVPVVATDVGGLSEAVEHGVGGYLVPRRTDRRAMAEELAGYVEELLGDEDKRRRFGEAAARRARAEFSARSAARAHVRLYRRCLAGKADAAERKR